MFRSHGADEMCNFYLMFSSPTAQVTRELAGQCGSDGSVEWRNFKEPHSIQYDDILSTRIPVTAQMTQQSRNHTTDLLASTSVSSVSPSETEIGWHTAHGLLLLTDVCSIWY